VSAEEDARSRHPNVVLITIDNHNTSVLGFAGNRLLETPNIDRLAREGVFLSNYHTASRCSASRAAMLTGRYHLRSGAIGTGDARSTMGSLDQPTIADLFQAAGYRTAMFGKWHLGANTPFLPENRGFDEVVSYGVNSSTLPHVIGGGKAATKHKFRHNGRWEVYDGYRTDVWFNELSRFVRENREGPFFAYLATWSTHGPNQGPAGMSEKYRRKLADLGDAAWDAFESDQKRNNFLELATEMEVIDRNIGDLLKLLDELGLREHTIIAYCRSTDRLAVSSRAIWESYPSVLPHHEAAFRLVRQDEDSSRWANLRKSGMAHRRRWGARWNT
jgi:arylsulfatase A-like enzyme